MASLATNVNDIQTILNKTAESVNKFVCKIELLIKKSNSLFQAQLMTAKTDQVRDI